MLFLMGVSAGLIGLVSTLPALLALMHRYSVSAALTASFACDLAALFILGLVEASEERRRNAGIPQAATVGDTVLAGLVPIAGSYLLARLLGG